MSGDYKSFPLKTPKLIYSPQPIILIFSVKLITFTPPSCVLYFPTLISDTSGTLLSTFSKPSCIFPLYPPPSGAGTQGKCMMALDGVIALKQSSAVLRYLTASPGAALFAPRYSAITPHVCSHLMGSQVSFYSLPCPL